MRTSSRSRTFNHPRKCDIVQPGTIWCWALLITVEDVARSLGVVKKNIRKFIQKETTQKGAEYPEDFRERNFALSFYTQETGKRHDNVLRDIRSTISGLQDPDFIRSNFGCKKNSTLQGTTETEYYELTQDAFTLVAFGFSGANALQFKTQKEIAAKAIREKGKD